MDLPSTVSECALDIGGVVCSDTSLVVDIDKGLNINIISDVPPSQIDPDIIKTVIETAKRVTKCDSEKCVLDSGAVKGVVDSKKLEKNKTVNFKPVGPHNSTQLLSNINIDNVLSNLVHVDKHKGFYHMNFQMIDFPGSKRWKPTELATINICNDVIEVGHNCMGVVLNTDTRSGSGEHWFCIFCDFRGSGSQREPYTLEYFNSSGNPPRDPVLNWLNKTAKLVSHHEFKSGAKKRYCEKVISSTLRHQNSDTECGPYSLYYIWSRLNNEPITTFRTAPILDERMIEFRKHLFS
jgi:hypothetical protein